MILSKGGSEVKNQENIIRTYNTIFHGVNIKGRCTKQEVVMSNSKCNLIELRRKGFHDETVLLKFGG